MQALDRDLGLVGEGPGEAALAVGHRQSGLDVDEQLRDRGRGEEPGDRLDRGVDVGRFAVDRDLARPGERGATVLARGAPGSQVLGPLVVGEGAHYRAGDQALDELVVLQYELLAGR